MENITLPLLIASTYEEMDAFGTPITLNYKQRPVYQTKCGATLTLICGFISICAIIIFGKEVLERKNPTIISYEYLMPKEELMRLQGIFQFFFGFIDSNFVPLKERNSTLFNFTMIYVDKQHNITRNLEIDYCSNSNSFRDPELRKMFSDVDIDNLFCLKNQEDLHDLDFKGQFGSSNYKYIQINIQTCTTMSCGSQKTIDYLMSSFFIFYFTEIVFNPKDYINPLTKFSNSVYTRVSLFNKKNLLFKMKHSEYLTDKGYFYEEMDVQNSTTFDSFLESIKLNPNNQSDIITFQTQIGDKANRIQVLFILLYLFQILIFQRKYLKVTDLLAYLGGFLKILFLICQIIAFPINKISMETEFANQIFNFEKPIKASSKLTDQLNENISKESKHNSRIKNQQNEKDSNNLKSRESLFSPLDSSNRSPIREKLRQLKNGKNSPKASPLPPQQLQNKAFNCSRTEQVRRSSYEEKSEVFKDIELDLNKDSIIQLPNNEMVSKLARQNTRGNRKSIRQTCLLKPGEKLKKKVKKIELMQTMMKKVKNKETQILSIQDYQYSILKIGRKIKNDAHLIFQELFNILHRNVRLQIYDYINYIWAMAKQYFCCVKVKDLKQLQIRHAINLLTERMDIVFIMKKLLEIEKIKMLILDKDQREIFQYLPKPLVKYNPNNVDLEAYNLASNYQDLLFYQQEEDKSYEKCLKAAKAFKRIKNKENLTQMDLNVFEIIGERSQKLLDFLDDNSDMQTPYHQRLKQGGDQSLSQFKEYNLPNTIQKQDQVQNGKRLSILKPIIKENRKAQTEQQKIDLSVLQQSQQQIQVINSQQQLDLPCSSARKFVSKHEFNQMPKKVILENGDQELMIEDEQINYNDNK